MKIRFWKIIISLLIILLGFVFFLLACGPNQEIENPAGSNSGRIYTPEPIAPRATLNRIELLPATEIPAPTPAADPNAFASVEASPTRQELSEYDRTPDEVQAMALQDSGLETTATPKFKPTLPPVMPAVGFLAPEFSLPSLDGGVITLSDLRGKNILLNYWVTWCPPCLEEMESIDRVGQEFEDQDFIVLSVNGIEQDQLATVREVLAGIRVGYPVILDENDQIYRNYEVLFMPTSFFIDKMGVIRYIKLGSATEDEFRIMVEKLVND